VKQEEPAPMEETEQGKEPAGEPKVKKLRKVASRDIRAAS